MWLSRNIVMLSIRFVKNYYQYNQNMERLLLKKNKFGIESCLTSLNFPFGFRRTEETKLQVKDECNIHLFLAYTHRKKKWSGKLETKIKYGNVEIENKRSYGNHPSYNYESLLEIIIAIIQFKQ